MTSKYCIEEKSYLTDNWVPTQYFDNREDAFKMFEVRKYVSRYDTKIRDDIRLVNLFEDVIESNCHKDVGNYRSVKNVHQTRKD